MKAKKSINNRLRIRGCIASIFIVALCLTGCGQDEKLGLEPTDDVAPGVPVVTNTENINGGAIISFNAPKDNDLLCVVATYTINGVLQTTKASPYINKLKIEGFGKVGSYEVTLKSVDKSKNESASVTVTIEPQIPPMEMIYNSLKVVDSFGGIKLFWDNPTEANIIIEILKKKNNEWASFENIYSSSKEGKYTIRGMEAVATDLKYRVRDRWDNYSESLEKQCVPLKETQLDKSKFRVVTPLPGDARDYGNGLGLTLDRIWDGDFVAGCYHGNGDDMNRTLTFDMGQTAKLSRFRMWQRTADQAWIYNHNNLKRYAIYGCNEITPEMYEGGQQINNKTYPTFEGWTKIMDVECYKPSGDSGIVTNEDKEYILSGDEHEIPIDAPAFRYMRLLMLENWSGGTYAQIGEMTFWGEIIK